MSRNNDKMKEDKGSFSGIEAALEDMKRDVAGLKSGNRSIIQRSSKVSNGNGIKFALHSLITARIIVRSLHRSAKLCLTRSLFSAIFDDDEHRRRTSIHGKRLQTAIKSDWSMGSRCP